MARRRDHDATAELVNGAGLGGPGTLQDRGADLLLLVLGCAGGRLDDLGAGDRAVGVDDGGGGLGLLE